jgi:hypothetical protein
VVSIPPSLSASCPRATLSAKSRIARAACRTRPRPLCRIQQSAQAHRRLGQFPAARSNTSLRNLSSRPRSAGSRILRCTVLGVEALASLVVLECTARHRFAGAHDMPLPSCGRGSTVVATRYVPAENAHIVVQASDVCRSRRSPRRRLLFGSDLIDPCSERLKARSMLLVRPHVPHRVRGDPYSHHHHDAGDGNDELQPTSHPAMLRRPALTSWERRGTVRNFV